MLHRPLRSRNPTAPVSRSVTMPAPYGGWNARDSIAAMPETDAIILDNWVPSENRVTLRKGYAPHATGLPDDVETLMTYSSPTAEELWAVSGGGFYDVTTAGAVGAAAVSGQTSSRWQNVQFGTSAGTFLIAVNGIDKMQQYDGSAWKTIDGLSTPAITGIGTDAIINIGIFKRRIFFIENNSLSFWYLPVDVIAGAATEFTLGPLFQHGGKIVAMGAWSRDTGTGPDDFAVFLTSEGEVAIYQGNDPGDANAWGLVGVYRIGKPIGNRCLQRIGPELFVMCEDGFYSLSQAIGTAQTNKSAALSEKIRNAVEEAVDKYQANFGWQMQFYPKRSWLIVNVPISENLEAHQYVANTTTGAWTRLTGMNAFTWALFDGGLYFGGADIVYVADHEDTDNGNPIRGACQQAFGYLGASGNVKLLHMMRPFLRIEGTALFALDTKIDFEAPTSTEETEDPWVGLPSIAQWDNYPWTVGSTLHDGAGLIYAVEPGSAIWDVAEWDTAKWQTGTEVVKQWKPVNKIGTAVSNRLYVQAVRGAVYWMGTQWMWQPGGML